MIRILRLTIAATLLVLGLAGAAVAKSVPLYPQKVDLHFVDAKGKLYTIVMNVNVEKAALGSCMGFDELIARRIALEQNKPALYTMAYVGSTCHGEKPAKANVANAPAPAVDDRPAIVVLFYIDQGGKFHYSSFGRKSADYRIDTCPLVLRQTEAALRKQAQADHVGQEYRGADCFVRSVNRTNFTDK
ncbi:MAG: hypothetical protein EON57_02940 [Alphaproteobacteria bacterium]|nr:MAG: hypothetical protein EON57_02940 [Alphaproteobacteria bacterium]